MEKAFTELNKNILSDNELFNELIELGVTYKMVRVHETPELIEQYHTDLFVFANKAIHRHVDIEFEHDSDYEFFISEYVTFGLLSLLRNLS